MIRDSVLAWGSLILVIVLAFILMPTYERFKDAQGREVDVDPNAPPMPEWLKSKDPRKEGYVNDLPVTVATQPTSISQTNAQKSKLPSPSSTESTVPSGVNVIPSISMPSENGSMLSPMGSDIPNDVQTITRTLPAPNFGPHGMDNGYGDKYVLKSSLVPCATGSCSKVPGGNDGMTPTAGGIPSDGISKPFSAAFGDKTEPEGYLNSFAAFMK